jgi:hypothetical protein
MSAAVRWQLYPISIRSHLRLAKHKRLRILQLGLFHTQTQLGILFPVLAPYRNDLCFPSKTTEEEGTNKQYSDTDG